MNILGLMHILLGGLDATQEALMDKALQNTYALKGINFKQKVYNTQNPPLMEDLLQVMEGMA